MDTSRLHEISVGHDLDGGGYAFEDCPTALKPCCCVVWQDPDPDYVPWIRFSGFFGLDSPIYAFAPNSGHSPRVEWPQEYQDGDQTYRLIRNGSLDETERECTCHGRLDWWTGAAGDPAEPIPADTLLLWVAAGKIKLPLGNPGNHQRGRFYWEYTGNSNDQPHPECDRCTGDGYVVSEGGDWALYAEIEQDETDQD